MSCQMWEAGWADGDGVMDKWGAWQKKVLTMDGASGSVQAWDPQHSLVLSAVSLCIPGVIHNLQKARVIECQYVSCLQSTPEGTPIQMCVKERDYGWCKYVYGEMFNLIPFANILSDLAQNVQKALSHPLELVGFAGKWTCKVQCTVTDGGVTPASCSLCLLADSAEWLLGLLCDLGIGESCEGIWEELTVEDSICESI